MIPLLVECELSTAWVPPAMGLHLDGLLAWVLVNDSQHSGISNIKYEDIIHDLPLEKHESGVWCASHFVPVDWVGQERRYLTARTPVDEMSQLIGKGVVETKGGAIIDTVRGIAKNGQTYFTTELTLSLRAWCIGDQDAISDLLSRVPAIGVKNRMGFGTIIDNCDGSLWNVTPCEEASQMWKHRNSPVKLTEESFEAVGAWQTPYWQGKNRIWRPAPMRLSSTKNSQEKVLEEHA
jgi:CRISPR type IV-associated protein Csf3